MKKIKAVIIAIILILGFVVQCETFQYELSSFNVWYYCSTDISFQSEEERVQLLQELYQYAEVKNVHVFANAWEQKNTFSHVVHLYGDSSLKELFEKEHGISEKTYRSLISGESRVVWHEFSELIDYQNRYVYTISFIGDDGSIRDVYEHMKENFTLTVPVITTASESDIIYLMWGIIAGILVLLSCMETALRKKEVVVRIFLGESVWGIILKSTGLEILVDYLEFILVKTVVFHFISGECMKQTVFLLYSCGILVSCLSRLTYADYDMKKAFSNAGDFRAVLNFTYVLKIVITAVSVFMLVNNFSLLLRDLKATVRPGRLDGYSDYSYLYLIQNTYYRPDISEEELDAVANEEYGFYYSVYENLYKNNYEKTKPVICQTILNDRDRNLKFVLVNEFGEPLLTDFIKDLDYDKNADAIYFVPKTWADNEQVLSYAGECLEETITDVNSPVIIFSRFDGAANKDRLSLSVDPVHMMFKITDTDMKNLEKQFHLEEKGYETVITNAKESSKYRNSLLRTAIAFLSSICVFTLVLQMILIVSIVSMEYRFRAMELAIKKILGYGMWKKNMRLFLSCVFTNLVAIPALAVFGKTSGMYRASSCVKTGICVMILELVVIVINILRVESKNIQKILKGGCL